MRNTIFITGAASGIGKAAAILFANNNWLVCATDNNRDELFKLRGLLGNDHCCCHVDVRDSHSISNALDEFSLQAGGKMDVLLNSAGILTIDDFEKITLAQNNLVTQVNVDGVLNMTYLAKPLLNRSSRGVVINMCSASSNYGIPGIATYSASKFWVKGFTEALNIEWDKQNIHVCGIHPNFVATPMTDSSDGKVMQRIGVNITAETVANTIWKAAHNRRKVHWHIDSWIYNLNRTLSNIFPNFIKRLFVKMISGY